jgi:hypothetical protein
MFSLPDMRLKDIYTVMTSPPMHVAVHIETDITLTGSDDLTRLTNAHEESRHNTMKPT